MYDLKDIHGFRIQTQSDTGNTVYVTMVGKSGQFGMVILGKFNHLEGNFDL